MEILLRVATPAGVTADVAVQVDPADTVGALADALIGWFAPDPPDQPDQSGCPARFGLVRVPGGEWLEAERPLGEVGLVSGEHVAIEIDPGGPRSAACSGAADRGDLDVMVSSGPDVGASVRVGVGSTLVVGRDRGCGLQLTDPTVGRRAATISVAPVEAGGAAAADVDAADAGAADLGTGGSPSDDRRPVTVDPFGEAPSPLVVNGDRRRSSVSIGPCDVLRLGATTLRVRPRPAGRASGSGDDPPPLGTIGFHRAPYYPTPVTERAFDPLGEIPERGEPPRLALLAALAPLGLGITLAVLYSPRMLLFAVFSPVMAVAAYLEARRRRSSRYGRDTARYERRLAERRVELGAAFADERVRRFASAPDLATLARRAADRSIELWVRDRRAPDFASLRLGLGDVEPAVTIGPETTGDADLRDALERELRRFRTIRDVPVDVDLQRDRVVAAVGEPADTAALASSLITQAACLHSPEDLVIVAATNDQAIRRWLPWLPHVRAASSPLAGDHLVGAKPGTDRLLQDLVAVVEGRTAGTDRSLDRRWPWILAVIDASLDPDPAVVAQLLDGSAEAGLSVLWLAGSHDRVPRQATAVVSCRSLLDDDGSVVAYTDPDRPDQPVEIDRIGPDRADVIARSLAPVRDASSATGASALPRTVTLHEAWATGSVDARWVEERWATERGGALVAPIGLAIGGPLVIDLVEHGPHGLIGGTSGSGKSELLMSLVAGLAAYNPPDRVNLLFVDYKGGASSSLFERLPHTVGYVTNLDASLAQRALVSLGAELNRRMALLEGRARDLAELRIGHPEAAPPSLVIVVDEFATLVKEIPEFVTGIVDIAQRGRSLGIHLLLATQRPSGAVNENILANTNLRISLRMLDGAESSGVIGTTDAAAIPTPLKGRGFARFGPGELVSFQSAWSGAPLLADVGPAPITVAPVGHRGHVEPRHPSVPGRPPPRTQVDGAIDAIVGAARALGHERGRSPWLDELPTDVARRELTDSATTGAAPRPRPAGRAGCRVVIGLLDDPAAQAQYPAEIELADGGLAVFGTGGSGKTTVLATVAAAVAEHRPAPAGPPGGSESRATDPPAIVGLDFASRQLTSLAAHPACVGVATGDDLEAVTRLIALLDELLTERRAALAAASVAGRPAPDFGIVLLLVDDYGALVQAFEGPGSVVGLHPWLERLNRVIVDGHQVGIVTALTAARRGAIKASVQAAIANRLVLRQAEPGGYTEHGLRVGAGSADGGVEGLPAGRGFLNGAHLVQVARPEPVDTTTGRRSILRSAPLPSEVDLLDSQPDPLLVPVGITDLTLAPAILDLTATDGLILGEPRSGRSTALAVVAHHLAAGGLPVWAIGPATSPLAELEKVEGAAFGRATDLLEILADVARRADGPPDEPDPWLIVDDLDLIDETSLDGPMGAVRAAGVRVVAATTTLRGYTTNPLVADLRRARAVLYLQPPDPRTAQEVLGVAPPLRPGLGFPPGRGVLSVHRRPLIVQVSRP